MTILVYLKPAGLKPSALEANKDVNCVSRSCGDDTNRMMEEVSVDIFMFTCHTLRFGTTEPKCVFCTSSIIIRFII